MAVLAIAYLEALAVKGFSEQTLQLRHTHLNRFIRWAIERDVTRPNEVTRPMVERYQKHLFYYRNAQDQRLGFRAQHNHLVSVRGWMKWLAKSNHILYNPAAEIELPRIGQHLPKQVLSPTEAETVLNQADIRYIQAMLGHASLETTEVHASEYPEASPDPRRHPPG